MILSEEERKAIVAYRLERANQSLEEVVGVSKLGYWNLAANRLYYAAYYASVALLISNGIDAPTHKGVIRMIGSNFVTNGIITVEDAKLLGRLFAMRQSGDYEDLFDWEESDVAPLIPLVGEYISRITHLINPD